MTSPSLQGGIANASENGARLVTVGPVSGRTMKKKGAVTGRCSANLGSEKMLQSEGSLQPLSP